MTFTDKPPTEPGFYAWKRAEQSAVQCGHFLIDVETGVLCDLETGLDPDFFGGLWCRLVPAEEVEKAFMEGHRCGYQRGEDDCSRYERGGGLNRLANKDAEDDWKESRARCVAYGEEV